MLRTGKKSHFLLLLPNEEHDALEHAYRDYCQRASQCCLWFNLCPYPSETTHPHKIDEEHGVFWYDILWLPHLTVQGLAEVEVCLNRYSPALYKEADRYLSVTGGYTLVPEYVTTALAEALYLLLGRLTAPDGDGGASPM